MKDAVRDLYYDYIQAWNDRSAEKMAALMVSDGNLTGFDGSQMDGPADVLAQLSAIFRDFPTGEYVTFIKSVRPIGEGAAVLRAASAILPRGFHDINPDTCAFQTMVAVLENHAWKILSFQNTPAQFHLNPKLRDEMAAELRRQIPRAGVQ